MSTKGAAGGPKFVAMFGPVLNAVRDLGGSARPREVYDQVAESLRLKAEAKSELTPSGASRYENRIAWARFYLVCAGLLDSSKRGVWSLTEKGREHPDISHAQALEMFRQVRAAMAVDEEGGGTDGRGAGAEDAVTPDDEQPGTEPANHSARVIEILQALTPSGFERFCQRLLREAGFQNVVVTGRSGDGGIDGTGILEVNTLVSFKVLFQCKRYREKVSPAQVRDFRGAMMGRADKGIILTTGGFTAEARREAVRDGVPPIELVDGEKLVILLEELEIGLVPVKAFRVDEAFFLSFGKVLGEAEGPVPG